MNFQASGKKQQPGYQLAAGTAKIFLAELLFVPTGIITAAYLSRRFGPEGYGLLMLAYVPVILLESNVAAALSRPAIKLIGDASEWRGVGAAVLRLYLMAGLAMMLLVWATAAPLAALFNDAAIANYLRLLALDIPIFLAAQAHRNILVGLGLFNERAMATAVRWIARLVLIIVFVELSGTLMGAVWGNICASAIELAIYRRYVQPSLFERNAYSVRKLCAYSLPLLVAAICISLFGRLDLVLLKIMGRSAAEAGFYAGAQNLSLLPSLFSFALAPVLLSSLGRALRDEDLATARRLGQQTLRAVLLLLPAAAIAAAAAEEIVGLVFGQAFLPTAEPLRLLTFGALALVMVAVGTTILISAGRQHWTLHLAWPLVPCAAASHLLLIPRFGAWGAALGTTVLAGAAALVTLGLVHRIWRISPGPRTFWRTLIVSVTAYAIADLLPASGSLLIVKLVGAVLWSMAFFFILGEFTADELGLVRGLFRRRNSPLELPSKAA